MSIVFTNAYTYWDRGLSVVYAGHAVWHALQLASCNPLDGFALTYHPFSAGTFATLAVSPGSVRVGHALMTAALCVPHAATEKGARYHVGQSFAFLGLWAWQYYAEQQQQQQQQQEGDKTTKKKKRIEMKKIRISSMAGRILSGLLGVSQLGISLYFARSYWTGNPDRYEPFIRGILTTTDKVPDSTLTDEFVRGVYLAGTYAVSGMAWTLPTLLLKAVYQNDATACSEILQCNIFNLASQVVLHTIGYLAHAGGNALGDYMYVHGPMSAPALGSLVAALYLVQRPNTTSKSNDDKNNKKSDNRDN